MIEEYIGYCKDCGGRLFVLDGLIYCDTCEYEKYYYTLVLDWIKKFKISVDFWWGMWDTFNNETKEVHWMSYSECCKEKESWKYFLKIYKKSCMIE